MPTHAHAPKKAKNTTILILSLIMVINALAYGIIIPLLYPYAERFGITPLGMGFLFTSFSIMQFISTPILGRLSDRYGRRPILLICLLGTAISLAVFAAATNIVVLFVARMIDGVTGGNVSVAQAVISDSTEGSERAKAFGMLGAAFGLGFLLGPAIGGLMSQISIQAPFYLASALAFVGVIAGAFLLPETLKPSLVKVSKKESLFKFKELVHALFVPATGIVMMISFLAAVSMNAMIIGFQTFTNDVLMLNTTQIGLFFSVFGLIGVLMQVFAIGWVLKRYKSKKTILVISTAFSMLVMFAAYFARSPMLFFVVMSFFGITSAFRDPMLSALLTERTRPEDQGGILGINQAYISLGQIFGPLMAGVIATYSVPSVFLLSGGLLALALVASRWLYVRPGKVNL